ncbi:aldo/keto reductase family oxidoreductase [Peribacillus sp. CSMR9]|uniref:aldo/keto reductase n=1 Tax=Peribacillus sp. CSMR9 TaxID=2981350 RepID=UPI0029556808|nr:aldo/keto reductase family oxidoreductase [Peribacillus sp. CSMR9]MDV7767367.1 aldo/keto reductase family oxidoreductase [Peribacillus sp. CSMR9]
MQRVNLTEDLSLSRIVHGMWRLADWKFSTEEILSFIEHGMDRGVTTYDHADIYGSYTCEEIFGNALSLKPSLREKMEIVTKCGIVIQSENRPSHKSHHYNTNKTHIIKSVEQSLMNLKTDYIDLLLIHRPDPLMDPSETAEAFNQLKESGKVRNFGVSNFKKPQWDMLQAYLEYPLVTNQLELSAYNLENFEDGTINFCQEMGVAPMAWSPLAGGSIFEESNEKAVRLRKTLEIVKEEISANGIDEVMYAWLLRHPAKIIPIVGSGKKERLDSAIDSLNLSMKKEQWFNILTSSMGHDIP